MTAGNPPTITSYTTKCDLTPRGRLEPLDRGYELLSSSGGVEAAKRVVAKCNSAVEEPVNQRVAVAFDELALAI
jgi:hypothetical protein